MCVCVCVCFTEGSLSFHKIIGTFVTGTNFNQKFNNTNTESTQWHLPYESTQ